MEKQFSEQDSIRLINEMIAQARDNIRIGSAKTMIISGYSVAATAILNVILIHTLPNPYMSFWIWWLMLPMGIINSLIDRKAYRAAIVKTHIDKIIGKVWWAFGCSIVVFLIIIFGMCNIFNNWMFTIVITPVIMCLMALAQYVTAIASRFRLFLWSSYLFWISAALCMILLLVWRSVEVQFIILSVNVILGFVVPGHILNHKAKENV